MFTDDCKPWKRRAAVAKTWAQLKIDFSIAHNEPRESNHTTRSAGFHANNVQDLQQETATTIVNLANATLADRETMTFMQSTIATLTAQLSDTNQKLVDALNLCATLKEKVAMMRRNHNNNRGRGNGAR